MALNIAQGRLYGTIFESILYGIYLLCFLSCLYLFRSRYVEKTPQNKIILAAMSFMFCLSTAHLGCTIQTLQVGFFDTRPALPEVYFTNRATPLNLVVKSLNGVNMVTGDCLMLYRLWVIYQGNLYVMFLPTLTMLGTGTVVFLLNWYFSNLTPTATSFQGIIKKVSPAAFVLPFATNVMITGLIIFRIVQSHRAVKKAIPLADSTIYYSIISSMVESCVLYPVVLFIAFVMYLCNSDGQDVLTGALTQVVSIVATLMWLQVRLGLSRYDITAAQRRHQGSGLQRPTTGSVIFARPDEGSTAFTETNGATSSISFSFPKPKINGFDTDSKKEVDVGIQHPIENNFVGQTLTEGSLPIHTSHLVSGDQKEG